MKKIIYIIFVISFISCEDVIEVDLDNEEPRVVIECTGIQEGNNELGIIAAQISKTAPYFSNNVNYFTNAEVSVTIDNVIYLLSLRENTTVFADTLPMIYNVDYVLNVEFEGENYKATTQLYKTVPIDYVEQDDNSFDEELTSINAYFTDPAGEENYYFFQFASERNGVTVDSSDDELFDGNQISTFYADEFEVGDQVNISISGISKQFEDFYSILISQTGESGGGPFGSNPVSVRGNIINPGNPSKFAFGYFRMSQEFSTVYTIE
jgi:hypothetical protein